MKSLINTLFIGATALLAFGACSDVPMPYEIGGSSGEEDGTIILSTTFAGGKGDFTIQDVTKPDELAALWTTGTSYIKASGSAYLETDVSSPTKFDAESWLISPTVDLSNASHATLTFEHAARYFYGDTSGMRLLVSEAGTNVWNQLTIPNWPDGSDWTFVSSGDISLDDYLGKQIQIAFQYISTSSLSPTWEIKNLLIEDREATETETPDVGEGDGTRENPFNVEAAMAHQDGNNYWVKAYIVGDVNGLSMSEGAEFTAPFNSKTNILIADAADESEVSNCMPVQLPSGEVRNAVNLNENEGNLGAEILIYGQLTAYFSNPGIRSVTAVSFDGGKTIIGVDPDAETEQGDLAELLDLSNTVTEAYLDFSDATVDSNYEKTGWVNYAEEGSRLWQGKSYSGEYYIQATAYGSSDATNVAWFISPAVQVSNLAVKQVTFDCATGYFVDGTKMGVYFIEKNGTELTYTNIEVTGIPGAGATNYEFATGLKADLSAFEGKTGFIGFKYSGSADAGTTATYQLDNIYIGMEAGGSETPSGETVTVTTSSPYEESFSSSIGKFTINDVTVPDVTTYIWSHDSSYGYMKASAYISGTNYASESWLVSPIVDLTSVSSATLTFDHTARYFNNASEEMTLWVTRANSENWQQVNITNYPSGSNWTFVTEEIDLSAYAGSSIQFAFKYVSTTGGAATWEIKNVAVSAGESGGGDEPGTETPLNENLLTNPSFETWTGDAPDGYNTNSAGNATIAQNSDAHTGSYSVYVTNKSSNTRLGSQEYTLPAGSYSYSVYVKNATTAATGKIRLGYVPVVDGTVQSSKYTYITSATAVTDSWAEYSCTFSLTEGTTVSMVVMSSSSTGDVLIDDISLIRTE